MDGESEPAHTATEPAGRDHTVRRQQRNRIDELWQRFTATPEPNEWFAERMSATVQHWSVLVPVVLLLLTAERIIAVSHGNLTTALAILQHTDTARLLVGVALWAGPMVYVAAVLALYYLGRVPWYALIFGSLLALIVAPVYVLFMAALVIFLVRMARKGDKFYTVGLGVLAGTLFLIMLVGDYVWLPTEFVVVEEDAEQLEVLGYVLSDDNDQTVILTEDSRRVRLYASPWLERKPCNVLGTAGSSTKSWFEEPILGLLYLANPPGYSGC